MSEPFLGQIQMFGFNFAPKNWALCAGQLMPIQQNTALFSLLGVNFGGNGTTIFGLPNFQGMAACAQGQGPGLTERFVGETFGSETVPLQANQMPAHNHSANLFAQRDQTKRHGTPQSGDALTVPNAVSPFTANSVPTGSFPASMIGSGGGGQPHANQQPYLALNFCIALAGVFPQRP